MNQKYIKILLVLIGLFITSCDSNELKEPKNKMYKINVEAKAFNYKGNKIETNVETYENYHKDNKHMQYAKENLAELKKNVNRSKSDKKCNNNSTEFTHRDYMCNN